MSGDYSRTTFDPTDHYNGVRMQQGRVQLDADWNEESDIQDRRWRAETVDVVGRCGYPEETPEAFLIENDGGTLTIGLGRMYVDGLLAENFGLPPLEFYRILAEERGTEPVPFGSQPYLPDVTEILEDLSAGTVLVYLDVWHREVTRLEDPDLVEVAVGVDTTTRQQTVWQVKILGDVGEIDCSTPDADIPDWLAIITPSGGRLTTEPVGVADPSDPCLIPPSGGYRGLENRLYRLEIHDGGDPGPATFKWSRTNRTVATAVTAISELDVLRVESTGRDDVLRFSASDWVEVTDDHLELAGLPGVIRRVDSVDDGTRTIVLRDDLPAGLFPTDAQDQTAPERHTRVRRWDQSGLVRDTDGNLLADLDDPTSAGVIPVPPDGTSLILEDGVQVTFGSDPAGGPVRSGDHWLFAARFADASVEELEAAPPLDIHHHYCRLAVAEFDGEQFIGTPVDCRPSFPPLTGVESGEGCCTEVVHPGDSIQEALDALPAAGGCVCVKAGLHTITEPLRIERSNVVLHGESPGARIRRENGARVIDLGDPSGAVLSDVRVEDLRLETGALEDTDDLAIVFVDRCNELALVGCEIAPDEFGPLVGIRLGSVIGGRIEGCDVGPVTWGLWVDTDATALAIVDNRFVAAFLDGVDAGAIGIWLEDAFGASRVERNEVTGFISGIYVNRSGFTEVPQSGAHGTRVAGNRVSRSSRQGSSDPPVFGIDVAALSCTVVDNLLDYGSAAYGGIRLTGGQGRVENNRLRSSFQESEEGGQPPIGIQLGFASEEASLPAEGSTIRGNRLTGQQDAIVVLDAVDARIADNDIDGGETGVRNAIRLATATGAVVAGNRVRAATAGVFSSGGQDNQVADNTIVDGGAGLLATDETGLRLTGNRIQGLSNLGVLLLQLAGSTEISGNRVRSCGFGEFALGVGVLAAFGDVRVVGNEVVDTGVSPDEEQVRQPALGLVALLVFEALIEGNLVSQSNIGLERDLGVEDRALLAQGLLDFQLTDNVVLGYPVQVVDNNFIGPGASHLVEIRETPVSDNVFYRFERVTFSDNHCWHWVGEADESSATVALRGRRAIVMGNHVKVTSFRPSFDFNGMTGTYIGNDTQGHGTINFASFPTPEANFNR